MQIVLLLITVVLSIVLYRLLSSHRATYPYIRTTRIDKTADNAEYLTTEAEEGLITIDKHTVIVGGREYKLKSEGGVPPQAYLMIDNGKLLSITTISASGEKVYFIDPDHSLYSNPYTENTPKAGSQRHTLLSC